MEYGDVLITTTVPTYTIVKNNKGRDTQFVEAVRYNDCPYLSKTAFHCEEQAQAVLEKLAALEGFDPEELSVQLGMLAPGVKLLSRTAQLFEYNFHHQNNFRKELTGYKLKNLGKT